MSWSPTFSDVTGAIGTITGIFGAGLGIFNYRRIAGMKKLEMRISLRVERSALLRDVLALPQTIETAKQSRLAIRAATGTLTNRHTQSWLKEATEDLTAVNDLRVHVQGLDADYHKLSEREIEEQLVEVQELMANVKAYAEKYRASMAEDDRDREKHAADVRQSRQS